LAPRFHLAKQTKVKKVMKEYKTGTLHSGKGGPVVKSRKQAIAIAMSEAKMSKKKGKNNGVQTRKDIKVPESYIQKLRDAGTKKAALEKYAYFN